MLWKKPSLWTIQQAALCKTTAEMEMFAVQRTFSVCQHTFILLWFACSLTAAKEHCLLMKAAFENLQLKIDFYQAILQSKNV